MKVITIAAPKGGCGKSTIASALAIRASIDSLRVALLDLNVDQGTLTNWWTTRGEPLNPRCFSDVENIKEDVEVLRLDGWEWLFVDTPPVELDIIEMSVIVSDAVIIPVKASIFDIGSIDPIVEMCRERRKPFAFVMSDVDSRFKGLNTSAISALVKHGHVLGTRISHRLAYVNAVTVGKTGPEIDKSLNVEIDGLWDEVKRLAASNAESKTKRAVR